MTSSGESVTSLRVLSLLVINYSDEMEHPISIILPGIVHDLYYPFHDCCFTIIP